MTDQTIEVIFNPHVSVAIACLVVAMLISCGLALIEWAGKK